MTGVTRTRISHRGSAAGAADHGSRIVGPNSFGRYDAIPPTRPQPPACQAPYPRKPGGRPRLKQARRLARSASKVGESTGRPSGETGTGREPFPRPFHSQRRHPWLPFQAASAAALATHPRAGKSGPFHNLTTRGGNQ